MKINKTTSISLLSLSIIVLLFFHFITYRNCQTIKIFKATLDFGTEHVQRCFSQNAIKRNIRHYIKTYLDESSFIYKFAVKYKRNSMSKDYESEVQKSTDDNISLIEKILKEKEKEILTL